MINKKLILNILPLIFYLACPVDSYGKKAGFTTGCTACPANSGTSGATGKLEIADCTCKLGFTGNPSRGVPCTSESFFYHQSVKLLYCKAFENYRPNEVYQVLPHA